MSATCTMSHTAIIAGDAFSRLCYRLSPRVRARREAFGLLFYESRAPKLTYVRCGDLLGLEPASGGDCRLTARGESAESRRKIRNLLEVLVKKGLIVAATQTSAETTT